MLLTEEQIKLIDDLEVALGTLKPRLINKGPEDTDKLLKKFIHECKLALRTYNEELNDDSMYESNNNKEEPIPEKRETGFEQLLKSHNISPNRRF